MFGGFNGVNIGKVGVVFIFENYEWSRRRGNCRCIFEMELHIFNIKRFNVLFKKWSAKNVIFDVCYGKRNDKCAGVVINCGVTGQCDMSKNGDLRFICNHECF